MLLPVIFPTIFYNLIRSSLSLFMVALGFVSFLHSNQRRALVYGVLFTFIGFNLHSQYILISALFVFTYFMLRFRKDEDYVYNFKFILGFSVFLIFGLLATKSFVEELSSLLSVLPTSDLAASKLGYLEVEDSRGFRVTSLLSILIYPYMMYHVLKKRYWDSAPFILNSKEKERKFLFMFFAIICYSAAINIAYYDSAHLASRLGRFSDYLGMGILIPLYFRVCIGLKLEYVVLIVFAVIAPLIYGSIYINYY